MRSPFTAEPMELSEYASAPVVKRGLVYAKEGRVLEVVRSGDRLMARVQGTGESPYLVTIDWDGEEAVSDCTCPFTAEPFCKHAIAVLAAAGGRDHEEGEWVPPALPRRVEEISVRRERGRQEVEEGLAIRAVDGARTFGCYDVVSRSGRTYRVEIRSFRDRANWCTCLDYQTNLLGTCKHVEAVLHRIRRRFPRQAERLARSLPPQTFVTVDRTGEPRLRIFRGARLPKRLSELLDGFFDPEGFLRADPAADFPRFRREAEGMPDLIVGGDALDFAGRQQEESAAEVRGRREAAARVLACGPRLPGVAAELFPYQTEGVAFLAGTGRALLADDMGLGKTVQAIAASRWLMDREAARRTLVVCPASLKHQWAREIERFTGFAPVVVTGGVPARLASYRSRAPYTIVNYELVLRDAAGIGEFAPDLLILDEAQRIKNWRAKTADAVKAIRSRFAFVLTGTPIENRLDDLYSIMQVVDRRILGPLWHFNERFVELSPSGTRVMGYRNLGRLRETLKPAFLRRDRELVLSQLPPRSDNRYYVEMTGTQRTYMEEAVRKAKVLLRMAEKRPLSPEELKRLMMNFQNARMACDAAGLVDKETSGSPKLDEFARILEEVCGDGGRKVVVFSEWEKFLRMAADRADQLGIVSCFLSGSVPVAKRGVLIDRFRTDPSVKVFF
ncbi:MAG: SNF2-related protein, partial [Planctomycetes bacterium]|nr:SNF2-related protein [Planctomycetota bacterium]